MRLSSAELVVLLAALETVERTPDIKPGSIFRRLKSEFETELRRSNPKAYAAFKASAVQTTVTGIPGPDPLKWN